LIGRLLAFLEGVNDPPEEPNLLLKQTLNFLPMLHYFAGRVAATWAAAEATLEVSAVTVIALGAWKTAWAVTVNDALNGVPIVAPVVSKAVATTVPEPGLTEVVKDQGGVSLPTNTTAGCGVPEESVTTTEMEACAELAAGNAVVTVVT
jgi:hypothetical protein